MKKYILKKYIFPKNKSAFGGDSKKCIKKYNKFKEKKKTYYKSILKAS